MDDEGWEHISATIEEWDPYCRGVLLLGLDAPESQLADAFRRARKQNICKGFAIGRTIFREPSEAWFAGEMDDEQLISAVADAYGRVIDIWRNAAAR